MNENKIENNQEFEPRIVAFVCNWCTYAGADLTGTSRLKYATCLLYTSPSPRD